MRPDSSDSLNVTEMALDGFCRFGNRLNESPPDAVFKNAPQRAHAIPPSDFLPLGIGAPVAGDGDLVEVGSTRGPDLVADGGPEFSGWCLFGPM